MECKKWVKKVEQMTEKEEEEEEEKEEQKEEERRGEGDRTEGGEEGRGRVSHYDIHINPRPSPLIESTDSYDIASNTHFF